MTLVCTRWRELINSLERHIAFIVHESGCPQIPCTIITSLSLKSKKEDVEVMLGNYSSLEVLEISGDVQVLDLDKLPKLRTLDLHMQRCSQSLKGLDITKLIASTYTGPKEIYPLTSLLHLDLDNLDDEAEVDYSQLAQLQTLYYPGTNFADRDLLHFTSLTDLRFVGAKITSDALTKLTGLLHLELSDCCEVTIDAAAALPSLKYLDTSHPYTDEWPENLTNLESLTLSGCPSAISDNLTRLTNISTLDISFISTDFVLSSTNLTSLSLVHWQPGAHDLEGIYSLPNLQSLSLAYLRTRGPPALLDRMLEMNALQTLKLSESIVWLNPTNVPKTLFLKHLDLSNCEPGLDFIAHITSLQSLFVFSMEIRDEHLLPLINLRKLNLLSAGSKISSGALLSLPLLVSVNDNVGGSYKHAGGLRECISSRNLSIVT